MNVITVNCFELTERSMTNHAFFTFRCEGENLSSGLGSEQQAMVDVDQSSIKTVDNPAHRKQVGYPAFAGQMRRYFTGTVRELRTDPPVPANEPAGSHAPSPEAT